LALKSIALTAFDRAAIAGYVPDMERLITSALDRLSQAGEFRATVELRRLAIQAICWNLMGLPPGPETEAFTREYATLLSGLSARIPRTRYGRALAARDRLLDRIREVIAARRAEPRADGLSRILAAEAPDGRTYSDDEALLEVHHIVVAGFIVYALMTEVLR